MLLITGASGYVGQHLLAALRDLLGDRFEQEVLPVWRSNALDYGVQLDLTDSEAVTELLREHQVSAVLHLAAEARTGECQRDPSLAIAGNVHATDNLLQACAAAGQSLPYFLYISTDMVFRGDRAPYNEDALTDAVSAYGSSKAAAERLVQSYPGHWAIIRPALIYGSPCKGKVSVLSATLQAMRAGEGAFFEDEIRTPVYINDLITLIIQMTKLRTFGIVNAGGPDKVSRYHLAQEIARRWDFSVDEVKRGQIGDDPQHAWRPRDISLTSRRAHSIIPFTPLARALDQIHDKFADL